MRKDSVFILTVFLVIYAVRSSGQNDSTKTRSKFQIGYIISPDYCFRTLQNNNGTSFSDTIIAFDNSIDRAKVGYTAGMDLCYNFSTHFGIESGVQISNKGFATKTDAVIFGPPPRRGFTSSSAVPTKVHFIYNFFYLDVPIKANFTFGKKKLRVLTGIGVTSSIFIMEQTTAVLQYTDGSTRRDRSTNNSYNFFNLSPTLSFGVDYKVTEILNIKIEPTFRYGVLKIIDAPVSSYLWNAGLMISVFTYFR